MPLFWIGAAAGGRERAAVDRAAVELHDRAGARSPGSCRPVLLKVPIRLSVPPLVASIVPVLVTVLRRGDLQGACRSGWRRSSRCWSG